MATLAELKDWEREAHSYWIDSLLAVDEMLRPLFSYESLERMRSGNDPQ